MLLRYVLDNHYSFNKRQDLSLVASNYIQDEETGLLSSPAIPNKVLPAILIYGGNASGKSNLLAGLNRFRSAVLFSHPKWEPGSTKRKPYKLAKGRDREPSLSEMDFIFEGVRYNYGFETTDTSVVSEWLYSFPRKRQVILFERNETGIQFGRELKGKNKSIEYRPDSHYLSAAIQSGHETLGPFRDFFSNIILYGSSNLHLLDKHKKEIVAFLEAIGTGVTGVIQTKESPPEKVLSFQKAMASALQQAGFPDEIQASMEEEFTKVELTSIKYLHKSDDGTDVPFDEQDESAGTRRLCSLLGHVFQVLHSGGVLVVDELDDSLHSQACEALVALFSSPQTNLKGGQLIATTHNTNLLESKFLRRDQFWFVEKGEDGASCLYPMTDIRTKKTDNKEKGYLQGRYGAIPLSCSISDFIGCVADKKD